MRTVLIVDIRKEGYVIRDLPPNTILQQIRADTEHIWLFLEGPGDLPGIPMDAQDVDIITDNKRDDEPSERVKAFIHQRSRTS